MYYTIFDIETTDLNSHYGDVVQFAYANLDQSFNLLKAESLYFYRPNMHWSEAAENIHHLSKKFLSQFANEFETNLKKMYIVLSKSNAVGFNNELFDNEFSATWMKRMGMPDLEINRVYDVMKIYRPVLKKRPKLVDLPEYIGLNKNIIETIAAQWFGESLGPHNASYDVTATALAFANAVRNGYVNDDSNTAIPIEDQRARESLLWEKDGLEDSDFSSTTCYVITEEDGSKYILNLCSNKEKFAFLKIPFESYHDVIATNSFNGTSLPIGFVNSIINAVESNTTFIKSGTCYKAQLAPDVYGCIFSTVNDCIFTIAKEGEC